MSVTQATLLGDTFGSSASGTIPIGGIIMWSGTIATIPTGWSLCNGTGGTPDLRERFIVGATSDGDSTYPGIGVGNTGGSADATLASHSHSLSSGGASGTFLTSASLNVSTGIVQANTGGTAANAVTSVSINTGSGSVSYSQPSVSTEGSSATNANLPPYYALAFIMRVS